MTGPDNMSDVLDVLCPMHVMINHTGHIVHVGDTLRKLRPDLDWVGARFLEVFALKRPRTVTSMSDLRDSAGIKLHLQLRDSPVTEPMPISLPRTWPRKCSIWSRRNQPRWKPGAS